MEHGSYLQGMETSRVIIKYLSLNKQHGSYLQGMETRVKIHASPHSFSTDPTYKEWKPFPALTTIAASEGTDPTYKEWKPENSNR